MPWAKLDDMTLKYAIEATLLDRGAVRRGRHLRVRCPVPGHEDRRPSCDVDLSRGWICRSCDRGGGLRELAELLGIIVPARRIRPTRSWPAPPAPWGVPQEVWAAWTAILEKARRPQRRLELYQDVFCIADWLRLRHQAVADARRRASALGDDDPRTWAFETLATRIATEAAQVESELDEVCRHVG
jgi:hypothetical protein